MPRAMVRRVRTVHVPVSWRRFLLRRQARFGTSTALALSIQIQGRSRQTLDLRRTTADTGRAAGMSELLRAIGRWLDARLQVGSTIAGVAAHPVPRSSASWWY